MRAEKIISNLQKFGLTKGETKVYLSLIRGSSTKSEIMRSSGVSFSVVYDILERLSKKGLASQILVDGKRKFYPAPPEKLLELIEKKRQEVENLRKIGKNVVSFLEGISKEKVVFANMYNGFNGLRSMLKEVEIKLKEEKIKEWLAMGVTSHKRDSYNRLWLNWHKHVRAKYKIKAKFIFCEKGTKYYNSMIKIPLSEVRYLASIPLSCITVTGNLSLMMKYKETSHFILIKDEEIAKTFREIFKFLWGLAKDK